MSSHARPTLRTVIADDEPINLLDLEEMLRQLGHEVVAKAESGHEILTQARAVKPDLAILDVRMPGLTGLQVARALAEEAICPTIMVSAYSDAEFIEEARSSGCLSYLVKPIRPSDLGPAIAVAMAVSDKLSSLQAELKRLEEAFQTRKLLDRARGVLMDAFGLREDESFRYIQLRSMNEHHTMRDIAQGVIDGHFDPNWQDSEQQPDS